MIAESAIELEQFRLLLREPGAHGKISLWQKESRAVVAGVGHGDLRKLGCGEGRGHPGLAPENQAQAGPIMIRRIDIDARTTMRLPIKEEANSE